MAQSYEINRDGLKLGPVWLMPGVSYRHVSCLLVASLMTIGLVTIVGHANPYILTEHLGVPKDQQGTVVGNLTFYAELVILALVGPIGALSDRIGRRRIFAAGLVIIGIGYVVYPLAASVEQLTLFRLIFAVGAACISAMFATVLADYPQEPSRGKLVGFAFFLNGLGMVILVLSFGNLPNVFREAGADPIEAGRSALWIVAGICVLLSLVVGFGLQPGVPGRKAQSTGWLATAKIGFREARNPRIALSYAAAMVSRGDMSIISVFMTLWLTQVGIARGMETAEALATGVKFFGVAQVAALLWAPVAGIAIDKMDRALALSFAMVLAGCGYLAVGLIPDPLGPLMYGAAVLMGIGEMSGISASQSLIGQEAPEHGRGAVIGAFSFCGALGILMAAKLGGYLFDNWMQSGPFVMMGCVNCLLIVFALVTYLVAPRRPGLAAQAAS